MPTFTTINSVELNFKGEFEDIEQLNLLYKDSNIQYPKFFKMNQLCKIGFLAVEQLLQHHTDLISKTKPSSVATIFSVNMHLFLLTTFTINLFITINFQVRRFCIYPPKYTKWGTCHSPMAGQNIMDF